MKKIITIICICLCMSLGLDVNADGLIEVNVDSDVYGYVGMKIPTQTVDLKLDPSYPDASFVNVSVGDTITTWFTNIPDGLSVVVDGIKNNDEIIAEFNGVISSSVTEGTTQIAVTIPEGYINNGVNLYEANLDNIPSDNARYIITDDSEFEIRYYEDYEIVGEVGKEIEPQDIMVEIVNCGVDSDDFDYDTILDHEFPVVNGLTPTVTDYDDVNLTITITYTGTPISESHDLIHTTILKENMFNHFVDRVVPDRDDVLFNIIDNTPKPDPKPIPKEEPIPVVIDKPMYNLPKTGIN